MHVESEHVQQRLSQKQLIGFASQLEAQGLQLERPGAPCRAQVLQPGGVAVRLESERDEGLQHMEQRLGRPDAVSKSPSDCWTAVRISAQQLDGQIKQHAQRVLKLLRGLAR